MSTHPFRNPYIDLSAGAGARVQGRSRRSLRHLDLGVVVATVLLCAFGAVMVFSATADSQLEGGLDPRSFLNRQLAFLSAGAVLLGLVAAFDYRRLQGWAPALYAISLLGLAVVLTPLGEVQRGAARWIEVGPLQIQPSEPAKLALIALLGALFAEARGRLGWGHVAFATGLAALPAALVFAEPDLGTSLVLGAVFGGALVVGGGRGRHFLALTLLAIGAVVAILQLGLLKEYQRQRITAFLDPTPDVQSYAYNLTQSKIAIGSGGLDGRGLDGRDTLTALDFVPEQPTDFIFTAVAEQLGFVGSSILLLLFAVLIWRALRVAVTSADLFGSVLAGGLAVLWAFQLFVNVGMTMGIMPITGIPLPFISYGGSSLITNLVGVGLLLSVHMRRFERA